MKIQLYSNAPVGRPVLLAKELFDFLDLSDTESVLCGGRLFSRHFPRETPFTAVLRDPSKLAQFRERLSEFNVSVV